MVRAYWNIGGESRAEYGKGFDEQNLFYMKQFYLAFPKVNALRSELSWTHYRILMTQKDSRSLVKKEADSKKDQMEPVQIIKDPYVLEFLNLKSNTSFFENELKQE